jgi:phosphatidate cytidylyltransferase
LEKEYNKNLIKRAFTALAIVAPIVLIIYLQNFFFFFLISTLVCALAYYEWLKNKFRHPIFWGFNLIFGYFWLLINLIIGDILFSSSIELPLSAYSIFLIVILNTSIFDTFAYVTGSNIGKHFITPNISPNKTWEGLVGGLIGSAALGFIISNMFNSSLLLILIFILGGILAFIGDLIISFHKRENNIKDTGTLLPGHGGALDRLDSHLLATPIILILTILVV